jgi:hypothetical protein
VTSFEGNTDSFQGLVDLGLFDDSPLTAIVSCRATQITLRGAVSLVTDRPKPDGSISGEIVGTVFFAASDRRPIRS